MKNKKKKKIILRPLSENFISRVGLWELAHFPPLIFFLAFPMILSGG
jgi:hypothetical protein